MKKQLKLPKFKNEDEEREFWANIDIPYQSLIKSYLKEAVFK